MAALGKTAVAKGAGAIGSPALEGSLGYALRRAQLSAFAAFHAALGPLGVRPAHFAVLMLIRDNPGLTQSAVSQALGIQKANFVTLLDHFERSGWTERRRAATDRRSVAVHLTRAGEKFVRRLEVAHDAMEAEMAERLGAKKTAKLLGLLREFARGVGATAGGPLR